MLDFGFSEILLTSAIALVVLGPERLPKVARQVGNWMGRARAMARQLSEQLEREVSADELLKEHSKPKFPPNRIGGAGGSGVDPYSQPLQPDVPTAAASVHAADPTDAAQLPPHVPVPTGAAPPGTPVSTPRNE